MQERGWGGEWIKAEQLPTPLECECVVTSLSISIFSHRCAGALCACVRASVCVQKVCVARAAVKPNKTRRRFHQRAELRMLSLMQTQIITLIVKSIRSVSERMALGGEEEEKKCLGDSCALVHERLVRACDAFM